MAQPMEKGAQMHSFAFVTRHHQLPPFDLFRSLCSVRFYPSSLATLWPVWLTSMFLQRPGARSGRSCLCRSFVNDTKYWLRQD